MLLLLIGEENNERSKTTGFFTYDHGMPILASEHAVNHGFRRQRVFPTVSNRGVELGLPSQDEYLKKPFQARVESSQQNGSIYFLPKPEKGNGHLGSVRSEIIVTILAKHGKYFFFETEDGRRGWNGKKWFAYYKDDHGDYIIPDFRMVSSKGYKLRFPSSDIFLSQPFTQVTKTKLYLMPAPESGHGNLGTVGKGQIVTVLAKVGRFYYFCTDDGRYGWNGKKWFR